MQQSDYLVTQHDNIEVIRKIVGMGAKRKTVSPGPLTVGRVKARQ